jgi:RNA polymerase sigma-70 factor, ECF subfamily
VFADALCRGTSTPGENALSWKPETPVRGTQDQTESDSELVRQAVNGRPDAYGELAHRWAPRLMAVCHARVRCRESAADLAQETLLRGFRSLGTLKSFDKFGPWLRGIADRVCLDWLKSRQRTQVPFTRLGGDPHAVPATSEGVDARLEQADEVKSLMAAVEGLPETHREVLMLFYYGEMTYLEMAELLGVSAATINARLTEARAILRKRLGQSQSPIAKGNA